MKKIAVIARIKTNMSISSAVNNLYPFCIVGVGWGVVVGGFLGGGK